MSKKSSKHMEETFEKCGLCKQTITDGTEAFYNDMVVHSSCIRKLEKDLDMDEGEIYNSN